MVRIRSTLAWLLLGAVTVPCIPSDEGKSLTDSFKQGDFFVHLRYRYEDVTDDGVGDRHARASTLRTAFGFRTAPWHGLTLMLEGEDVSVVGNELYRNAGAASLDNGIRDRPVVADPDDTEINQAFLTWQKGDTAVALGRSEITLDDQRFVGNVGWRQNHQSFDAVTVSHALRDRVSLFYGLLDSANRITGGRDEMTSHLANVRIGWDGAGTLTLFGYLLDYDAPARLPLSSMTLGARWAGKRPFGPSRSWVYEASFASQQDAADNPGRLDAHYVHLALGIAWTKVTARIGFERLDGNARDGQFQTPLATLHKFNGWADKFLSTPTNGLDDLYLHVSGKIGVIQATAVYHAFQAAEGSVDYGSELDLQATYKTEWGQVFGLKTAFYDSDDFAADTNKLMFWTAFSP